jgi:4-hydroxybenzoate polyprenyltransferase
MTQDSARRDSDGSLTADSGWEPTDSAPLVVDLDGTLLRSDLLIEGFLAIVAANPLAALFSLGSLRHGIAAFKAGIAAHTVDLETLPWNLPFVAWLEAEYARGRKIYLASASDRRWVEAIAAYFGFFAGWFASDGRINLKGRAKADALRRAFGEKGFDYAGNESADLTVWAAAAGVLVVNGSSKIQRIVRSRWPSSTNFESPQPSLKVYGRAIRMHQWLKNLLLLVPALAAHQFNLRTGAVCLIAFLSFSLCASSAYVLNDLIDLGRDRAHTTKRFRPLAAGAVPIRHGLALFPLLLGSSLFLALLISLPFVAILATYYVLTLAYSLYLKRQIMIDVVTLACLYGMRVAAGGIAIDVHLSTWLIAFCIFLFCSLALAKRCIEISSRLASGAGDPKGRAYRSSDLHVLESLSAGSGFTAVLVFALYVSSPSVTMLYRYPEYLWLTSVVLVYWIGRLLILAHRGDMDDDPVAFAATDWPSLVCVGIAAATFVLSL